MKSKLLAIVAWSVRAMTLSACIVIGAHTLRADDPAPTLEPINDINQQTKTPIKFQVKAKPAEATLRFGIAKISKDGNDVPLPNGMALDAKTGAFEWTPTPSQAGKYELTVSGKDSKDQEAAATVRINVKERSITTNPAPVGELLRKWYAQGTAAGHTGDFYDNRDRGHVDLPSDLHPQLERTQSGVAGQYTTLKHVTIGNSATAARVHQGGSNTRRYYSSAGGLAVLYDQYRNNNIYIYPEHYDHDPKLGDLFPANCAYLITSQGSSMEVHDFIKPMPYPLAAFRPEVKKKLTETGLLMPTLQMIFRSTNKHLKNPKEYLTGKAHPSAFDRSGVNSVEMVKAAHEIRLDNIPPMVQLKVVEEDAAVEGKDYFDPGLSEQLHDTPAAIARVVRGPNYVRRTVVDAEESYDVNEKPLTYHWVVLRGDAQRIRINPMNATGSVVEILVPYHEQYTIGSPVPIKTNRVDIGAFVHNGSYYSAPGFVTFFSLNNEARTYDATGRLLEIGYDAGSAEFSISDWAAFFAAASAEATALPAVLLRKRLKEHEFAAITKAGDEYQVATERRAASAEKPKNVAGMLEKAAAAFKATEDKEKAAQKAFDSNPSQENQAALKSAKADRQAAGQTRKKIEAEYQGANAKEGAVQEILTRKRSSLNGSVEEVIERALVELACDPNFYLENQQALDDLLRGADEPNRARVTAARNRVIDSGILRTQGSGFALQSVRAGDAPVVERLTRNETYLLQRFHAELLSRLVYPQFVTASSNANYVDQQITTPKRWRDVHTYDAKGNRIGWTRYDGDNVSEFTADGHVILEKDRLGRAVTARTVKYTAVPVDPKLNSRTLKQAQGDIVVHYEYAGDDDRVGRITKETRVQEKK